MEVKVYEKTTLLKVTNTELQDIIDTIELMKKDGKIKYYSALSGNVQIQLYDNN